MPTINIPPKIRFTLYLIGALGSIAVVYLVDKHLAGNAEFKLWAGLSGLLNVLAAAKVSTSDTGVVVEGTVEQTTTTTTDVVPDDETGSIDIGTAIVIAVLALIFLALIGVFGPTPLR